MKKPRLCIFSFTYLPSIGGLVSYLRNFGIYAKNTGYEVDIFCTNAGDPSLLSFEVIDGLRVHRCDIYIKRKILKIFSVPYFLYKIYSQIKSFEKYVAEADLVVVRHIYHAFILSLFPSLRSKVVFIVPLISGRLQEINSARSSGLRKIYDRGLAIFFRAIEGYTLKKLELIGVLSESKKLELVDYYKIEETRIAVVMPGVDLERFSPVDPSVRSSILECLGRSIDLNNKIVLTVCRLVEEKNLFSLLDSMKQLENAVLYIVGDGPLRSSLEDYSSKKGIDVVFWGYRADTENFYKVADVFVLASIYEGFGHVYLEAQACGCPVVGVANNPPKIITATEEIVIDDFNGAIAKDESPAALSKAINNVLYTGELSNKRKSARSWVLKNASWASHMHKLNCLRSIK